MKCKYDLVLFDLDGTLSKSHAGVRDSLVYALEALGKPVPSGLDDTSNFIGPPLMDTLEKLCGLTYDEALKAAELYKSIYSEKNKYKNYCYDGIKEVLQKLKSSGVKLAVATTKYEPSAECVLKIIVVYDFFDAVGGTSADGSIKNKAQVIPLAVERAGYKMNDKIVLIGDSKFDTEGANELGIDFIGVLYGYGLKEEMDAKGARVYAQTPQELLELLAE